LKKLFLLLILFACPILPQDSSSTFKNENPCEDKLLLQLKAKDSLSIDEMKIYMELKRDCEEYRSEQPHSTAKDTTLLFGLLTAFAVLFAVLIFIIN